ncbi:hypothetical protein T10_3548 [Trichinella papuae]|uniref:Uncharacterized protein n=1 Tax=Trichinella papuae TaxID=268474 RepID=A0A0V1MU71_9BILA|nr:hypothetical protein T10_3548 [Trichinella papuae]
MLLSNTKFCLNNLLMTFLNIQEQKSTSFQQFHFSLIEMIAICVSLSFQFADHFIDKVKNVRFSLGMQIDSVVPPSFAYTMI